MKVDEILTAARDAMTVKRVYSEPVERDGTTIIGVAAISGGGGGGSGTDQEGQEGGGVGFGMGAKPVGAYVIRDGQVRWQPAVDVNRLVTVAGVVTVAALVAAVRIVSACTR
ncbi:sporulation protein [Nocardia higoensis]|uniref:Sporulation protein n=2 Tax=Nocardia higoensis TaxID=228599 RepID=A0ABS0DCK3_9NOCA|nr:sporulation protein [Nocardia higoensis]